MPVQNIECKLTQGQIGRYLAGENLPEATLFELERHIAECVQCRREVDRQRRDLLRQAGLAAERDAAARLVEQIAELQAPMERAAVLAPIPTRRSLKVWIKPALLTAALAAILGAMALAPQWKEGLLGASVADALPDHKPVSSTVLKTPNLSTKMAEVIPAKDPAPIVAAEAAAGRSHDANGNDEPATRPAPGATSRPEADAPTRRAEAAPPLRSEPDRSGPQTEAVPSSASPTLAVRQPAQNVRTPARPNRLARRTQSRPPTGAAPRSTVRVYDPAGRLIYPR